MSEWIDLEYYVQNLLWIIKIVLVGKYVVLQDVYILVMEVLKYVGYMDDVDIDLKKIFVEDVMLENVEELFGDVDGILVFGGFGDWGIEGKIMVIKYVCENDVLFLGICLGM